MLDRLRKLWRKQPQQPTLWVEPSSEEAMNLRLEKLAEDRLHALQQGEHVLHDLTNCAYGSSGYVIVSLCRDGLLRDEPLPRDGSGYRSYRYRITPAGRDYLRNCQEA